MKTILRSGLLSVNVRHPLAILKDAYWVLHNISTGTKPHEPEDSFPYSAHRWKDDVKFTDGGGATIALFRSEKDANDFCEWKKSIETDNDLRYFVGV
jgi:hypothetical protein